MTEEQFKEFIKSYCDDVWGSNLETRRHFIHQIFIKVSNLHTTHIIETQVHLLRPVYMTLSIVICFILFLRLKKGNSHQELFNYYFLIFLYFSLLTFSFLTNSGSIFWSVTFLLLILVNSVFKWCVRTENPFKNSFVHCVLLKPNYNLAEKLKECGFWIYF